MVLRYEVNHQSGRSMVEMLGVLAVIGLLSIAGLYGYRHAMDKHKANEVINEANKRAVMAAAQIAALGDNATDEDLNSAYDDDYVAGRDDSEISTGTPSARRDGSNLRVIRYPNTDRKEFAVVIPEMEKDVCRTILNSLGAGSPIQALVDSKGYEITNCNNADLKDVEMVYKDDLSPTENNQTHYSDSDTGNGSTDTGSGGSGSSNNSDSGSQTGDDDFEDDSDVCPRGTKVYGEGNCIHCKKYDDCGCREIGMLSDGAGKCMCADENATACDGNKSTTCQGSYYIKDDLCHFCGIGVSECQSESEATSCLSGFFLENGSCYACPKHTSSCDNNGVVCQENYDYDSVNKICLHNHCTSNLNCDSGQYCKVQGSGSTPTFGSCKIIDPSKQQTAVIEGLGRLTVSIGTVGTWWAARNWCEAQGLKPMDISNNRFGCKNANIGTTTSGACCDPEAEAPCSWGTQYLEKHSQAMKNIREKMRNTGHAWKWVAGDRPTDAKYGWIVNVGVNYVSGRIDTDSTKTSDEGVICE